MEDTHVNTHIWNQNFWPETPVSSEVQRARLHAQLIEDDFDIQEGMCIFEITAGESSLAPILAQMHGDISIITLDFSKLVEGLTEPGVEATGELIPLLKRSYDRGFGYLSLAKMDRELSSKVMADVARVLAPGGRFRFAFPDKDELQSAEGSMTLFSREEIFDLVESLDYQVVSMRRFDPDGPYWQKGLGTHFLFDVRKRDRQ